MPLLRHAYLREHASAIDYYEAAFHVRASSYRQYAGNTCSHHKWRCHVVKQRCTRVTLPGTAKRH